MNTMSYKGYQAIVAYDEDAEIFHGEVVNLRDVITFQGKSVKELKKAFADSVEDYIDFCAQRGEAPEKPFSGQFVVRVDPPIHRAVATAAKQAGMSAQQRNNRERAQAFQILCSMDGFGASLLAITKGTGLHPARSNLTASSRSNR
jgi:predicted HicB family RNase H-like nuclease